MGPAMNPSRDIDMYSTVEDMAFSLYRFKRQRFAAATLTTNGRSDFDTFADTFSKAPSGSGSEPHRVTTGLNRHADWNQCLG